MQVFLKNISGYFDKQTRENGSLICPKHHIEHTGKNVYSIIIDLKLWRETGEEKYFERAKRRALRTAENLVRDPDNGAWIFWPGRLDGRNMSNSVIDSGAASDTLSEFIIRAEGKLSHDEEEKIKNAIFKNCDTYLKSASVGKELTNQRLWGSTGLASAYRIFKKKDWKEAVLASIERSLSEMLEDGTFPYHPNYEEYGIYRGICDTTPFYHSRHIAFIYWSLETLGESAVPYSERLIRATNLLVGMYQENGVKNMNLETKRWYFLSDYEVASNPYDIYALYKTYQMSGNKIYLFYAQKALKKLMEHQLKDGGVTSHFGKEKNFQCRIFWNANCAWPAKIIEDKGLSDTVKWNGEYLKHFKNSDIAKFRNKNYSCILRGGKQSMNVAWGPRAGGGSLLYFGKKDNDWENELSFGEWSSKDPLNFYAEIGKKTNLLEFLEENKKDLRALLYYAKTEILAGNFKTVWFRAKDWLKKVLKRDKEIASHFSTGVKTNIDYENKKAVFETVLSRRSGKQIPALRLKREYGFLDDCLKIRETLELDDGIAEAVTYNKHPMMNNLKITANLKFKESHSKISFLGGKGKIEISFSL